MTQNAFFQIYLKLNTNKESYTDLFTVFEEAALLKKIFNFVL